MSAGVIVVEVEKILGLKWSNPLIILNTFMRSNLVFCTITLAE